MTTKLLGNTFCTFKMMLSWRRPQKRTAFFGAIFLSAHSAPPLKAQHVIFVVVSLFLNLRFLTMFCVLFSKRHTHPGPRKRGLWEENCLGRGGDFEMARQFAVRIGAIRANRFAAKPLCS